MYIVTDKPRSDLVICVAQKVREYLKVNSCSVVDYLKNCALVIINPILPECVCTIENDVVVVLNNESSALDLLARIKLRHYIEYEDYPDYMKAIFDEEVESFCRIVEGAELNDRTVACL